MKFYDYKTASIVYSFRGLCSNLNMINDFFGQPKKKKNHRENIVENSLFIVLGMNIVKEAEYNKFIDKLNELNEILQKNNSHILVVRNDYDYLPIYKENKLVLSNIHPLDDTSLVSTDFGNILCLGGRTLVNRSWYKKKFGNEIDDFYERSITFQKSDLDDIINNGIKFNCVITNLSPSFMPNIDKNILSNWEKNDDSLLSDVDKEQTILDMLYGVFRMNKTDSQKIWIYDNYSKNPVELRNYQGGIDFKIITTWPDVIFDTKVMNDLDITMMSDIFSTRISSNLRYNNNIDVVDIGPMGHLYAGNQDYVLDA